MASRQRNTATPKVPRLRAFMAQPFLHPSTGVFYIRRRVPDELRSALGREYKRSLKTRDPSEAKARFAAEWTRSEEAFSHARAQLAGVQVLTKHDMQQLDARWVRQEPEDLEHSGNFKACLPPASDATAVESDWTAVMRPYLLRLSDIAKQRDDGSLTAKPDVLEFDPLSLGRQRIGSKARTLTKVFEAYKSDRILSGDNRSTRASLADFEGTVTRFVQMFGDLPVTAVTRGTVQEYRAKLAAFPIKMPGASKLSANELIARAQSEGLPTLSPATIRNRLRVLGAVLGFAVRMGWIPENPVEASGVAKAAGVTAAKSKASRRRKDYNTAELGTIFRSALFTEEGWRPVRSDFGQALYWLPILLYYTGARREELCQLRVSDVQAEESITFLSILGTPDDDDDGRTVKTESSRRRVPLHPDLLALGFLNYLGTVPASGLLFPSLQRNHRGFYSTNVAKAWTKYLRNVVSLDSPASPLHGFRHTFKTLSRQVGIPEDVHDAITGHSDGSVSREYGGMPLSRMLEELRRYPSAPGLQRAAEEG